MTLDDQPPLPRPGDHAWKDRRTMLLTGFNRTAMLSIATFAMYGPSGPGWDDIAFGGLRQDALHALESGYDRVTQPSMGQAVNRTPGAENWYAAGMPLEIAAEAVASAGVARAAAGLGRGLASSASAAGQAAGAEMAEAMGKYIGCLAPGTPVLTSRGWIHIEDVREADLAWACDEDTTGGCQFRRVTATSVKDGRVLWRVDLLDATGAPASLDVTPMHPVAVAGRGWVPAMDLEVGDQLFDLDGNPVDVTGARPLPGLHRVHNFTVARAHTYFAGGDGGVWVHNTSAINSVAELLGPGSLRGALSGLEDLAVFRAELGLASGEGTLARLDVGGNSFYGINAHGQPISMAVNAITRTHAEADAFQQASNAGVRGGLARLFVDRPLCLSCGTFGGVRGMARQLGLEGVEVVTPSGTVLIDP